MEFAELSELDIKRAEEYGKINNKYKKNKKDKIDILDYYNGKTLNSPYSSANSATSNSIKPYQLMPFFKTVIVDIIRLPNEELFNEYYGMSVEELIELERKGKVLIRLPDYYYAYQNIENDYLDPILSRNPPNSFLINMGYGYLLNNKLEDELKDVENLFKKEFDFGSNLGMEMGMIDPMVIASFNIITGGDPYLPDISNEKYKEFTHNNFNRLSFSGYGNVNTFLKELLNVGNGRLDWAFTYSTAYTSFLADPILSSLNGTHMVNYNMKEILNDLIIRTTNEELRKTLLSKSSNILCYDIGKTLSEEITTPLLFNLEESLDYDYRGAINALKSLERAIDKKNSNEIIDLTNELKTELYEAGQIAKNMRGSLENNLNRIKSISTTIGLLGDGAEALADPQVKPLLKAISLGARGLNALAETETFRKAIDRFVKFNKEDHVLYLYNNYERFSVTPKNDKIRIVKGKKEFKDDLSKKYEYYEYIYKNIPIIRVLIDITSRVVVGNGSSFEYTGEDEVQNSEVLEFLEKWRDEYLPDETLRLQFKHSFLYGKSYFIKSVLNKDEKKIISLKLINPKYIRPYYRNKQLIGYNIINENGRKEFIKKEHIMANDHSKNGSLVEKYIYMLDLIYPKITNKDKRPKLFYDLLFENLEKKFKLAGDYPKYKEMLLNSLKIARYLENLVYITIILSELGDLNRKFNRNSEALEFYEQAQKGLEGKLYSDFMRKLDDEIVNKIMETQELL